MTTSGAPADRSYAALWSMVRHHWRPHLLSSAVRALSMVPIGLVPYLLAQLVTASDDKARAGRFIVLLFAAGLSHNLLWTACDFYVSKRIVPMTYDFKRIAFNAVWAEDYQVFVDHPTGKTASYVNDMRDQVERLWDTVHFTFLPLAVSIPIYAVILYRAVTTSALIYLLFLVIAAAALVVLGRITRERRRHLTDTTATNNGRVFDSFANFANVFSFRAHRKEIARNNAQIDGLIGDSIRYHYALSTYWGVASLLIRGGLWGAVLGYSWYLYERDEITFAAMIVSVTVLVEFTNEYWEVAQSFGLWIETSADFREAYNYVFPGQNVVDQHYRNRGSAAAGTTAIASTITNRRPPGIADALEVRNLSFAYPDQPDRLVLDDVSFRVGRGEKLGVVGRSGEGKSTLIKILLGFYPPTRGEILVDGEPVDADTLNRLQSYVPQDTSLFQETIAYNIGYASQDRVDLDVVAMAADKANIGAFVESLPDGYDTLVGERGIKLSLGQRQRIAIARAFLKPSELLILDEATSSLDSETEAFIQEALENLWTDRAAIIIAHRLATLNNVDRIIVMEHGSIVEEGTKNELLAADGTFAELWKLQRAGML